MSALGVKQTWRLHCVMSATHLKATMARALIASIGVRCVGTMLCLCLRGDNEATRVHRSCWWRGSCVAACGVRAAARAYAAHRRDFWHGYRLGRCGLAEPLRRVSTGAKGSRMD